MDGGNIGPESVLHDGLKPLPQRSCGSGIGPNAALPQSSQGLDQSFSSRASVCHSNARETRSLAFPNDKCSAVIWRWRRTDPCTTADMSVETLLKRKFSGLYMWTEATSELNVTASLWEEGVGQAHDTNRRH